MCILTHVEQSSTLSHLLMPGRITTMHESTGKVHTLLTLRSYFTKEVLKGDSLGCVSILKSF